MGFPDMLMKFIFAMIAVFVGLVIAVLIIATIDDGSGCTRCCEYAGDSQKWLNCMTGGG